MEKDINNIVKWNKHKLWCKLFESHWYTNNNWRKKWRSCTLQCFT